MQQTLKRLYWIGSCEGFSGDRESLDAVAIELQCPKNLKNSARAQEDRSFVI